jgi:hypothetical protein
MTTQLHITVADLAATRYLKRPTLSTPSTMNCFPLRPDDPGRSRHLLAMAPFQRHRAIPSKM